MHDTSASENAGRTPVAFQLYTVRTLTEKDYSGTLEKVARIGYDAVEFGGFGGLSSKQIRKLLDDLGLQCAGSHEDIEELESELTKIIDFHLEIGAHYIICPYMPEPVQKAGGQRLPGVRKETGEDWRVGQEGRHAALLP